MFADRYKFNLSPNASPKLREGAGIFLVSFFFFKSQSTVSAALGGNSVCQYSFFICEMGDLAVSSRARACCEDQSGWSRRPFVN